MRKVHKLCLQLTWITPITLVYISCKVWETGTGQAYYQLFIFSISSRSILFLFSLRSLSLLTMFSFSSLSVIFHFSLRSLSLLSPFSFTPLSVIFHFSLCSFSRCLSVLTTMAIEIQGYEYENAKIA